VQQREQDWKQQIGRLTEQLREKQRDLTREQELRSKLEASRNELKKSTINSGCSTRLIEPGAIEPCATFQRPRSPLLRQQGQPPAGPNARRVGVPSTLRRHTDMLNISDDAISCVGPIISNTTRQVLGDLTNCEGRKHPDGKVKDTKGAVLAHSKFPDAVGACRDAPIVHARLPEAVEACKEATIAHAKLPEAVAFETPTKRCGDVATDYAVCESIEIRASPPVWAAQSPSYRLTSCENRADSLPPTPTPHVLNVKPALRKVPTNFTERIIQQRSLSCPLLGRKDDTKIKFADQLQEAASPPKWYLDWLSNDETALSGRREAKVQPVKLRELSPRRVHEPPLNKTVHEVNEPLNKTVKDGKEGGLARWR